MKIEITFEQAEIIEDCIYTHHDKMISKMQSTDKLLKVLKLIKNAIQKETTQEIVDGFKIARKNRKLNRRIGGGMEMKGTGLESLEKWVKKKIACGSWQASYEEFLAQIEKAKENEN